MNSTLPQIFSAKMKSDASTSSSLLRQLHFFATAFLVVACLTMNWANILTFNFTVICMDPNEADAGNGTGILADQSTITMPSTFRDEFPEPGLLEEGSTGAAEWDPLLAFKFKFSAGERSQAMTVVAIGALVANLPIVVLINWYGPRIVFALVGLMGGVVTALAPFALWKGFHWFIATRVLQGVAFAGDMATFGHFLANWTHHKRYAFLTATLALYVQLAPFFTFPIAGVLCNSSLGWPGVYYVHSFVSIVCFTAFLFFYKTHGTKSKAPNDGEKLQKVFPVNGSGKSATNGAIANGDVPAEIAKMADRKMAKKAQRNIPYGQILRSKAVWAIFISAVGDFTAVNLLYQFTPTYLYRVQGFAVLETGLMATVPPLVQGLMKEVAGLLNDQIPRNWMGETAKTKLFNSIALLSVAAFVVGLSFIPSGHGYMALALITAGEALLGFIVGGFYKSGPIVAGIYAPFVMGQVSTALTLTMLVVPLLINWLTPNNTSDEWAHAFWLVGAIVIASNTFYLLCAKGVPEPWAHPDHAGAKRKNAKRLKSGAPAEAQMDGHIKSLKGGGKQ